MIIENSYHRIVDKKVALLDLRCFPLERGWQDLSKSILAKKIFSLFFLGTKLAKKNLRSLRYYTSYIRGRSRWNCLWDSVRLGCRLGLFSNKNRRHARWRRFIAWWSRRRPCWVAWLTRLWSSCCRGVLHWEGEPLLPLVFRSFGWVDFFLRWTRPQCCCNIPKELVELASTFAGAVDIQIIINDQVVVLVHLLQDCCPLNHANFALYALISCKVFFCLSRR